MESVKDMLSDLNPCILDAPRYLIGSMEYGSHLLQANPTSSLPSLEIIFLWTDALVRTWLMANPSNKALDLLVAERRTDGDKGNDTPKRGINRYLPCTFWKEGEDGEDSEDGENEDGEDPSVDEGGGPSTVAATKGGGKSGKGRKSGEKGGQQKRGKGKEKEVI